MTRLGADTASFAGTRASLERMTAPRWPSRMRSSPARSVNMSSGTRLGPGRSASLSGKNSPTSRETDEAGKERSRSILGLARTTRIPFLSPERRIAAKILPAPAGQRGTAASGLNKLFWLVMNAFAAAMSSLRSKGCSAASSNQLFTAPTGWARRLSRPYSKPIGTRIPSPSAADAHSRNFDPLWTVAWSQPWNFRLPRSGSSKEIMISPKTREISANWASSPFSNRLVGGKKTPAKPAPANFGTASSWARPAQRGMIALATLLWPSPRPRMGKIHSGVSDPGRQQKAATPSSLSSSNLLLSSLIQVRAFSSSENGIGRFFLSAGGTLGSRAPMPLSERPSIRAAGLVACTNEIGTSRMICSDRSFASATSLARSRSAQTRSAKTF